MCAPQRCRSSIDFSLCRLVSLFTGVSPSCAAYPLRQKWVADVVAYNEGHLVDCITITDTVSVASQRVDPWCLSRLQHYEPTSHESVRKLRGCHGLVPLEVQRSLLHKAELLGQG
jgi:hypothetical protein